MDVRTLYLIVGTVFFTTPLAILFTLRKHRDNGSTLWCISWFAMGVAALLIAARDSLPAVVSFHLAHIFMMISYVSRTASITFELSGVSQKWFRIIRIRVWIAVAYVTLFSVVYAIDTPDNTRIAMVHSFNFLTCIELLVLTFQLRNKLQNNGSLLIAAMAVLLAFGFGIRALGAASGVGGEGVFGEGIDQVLIMMSAIVGYILGNLGYLQIRTEQILLKNQQISEQLLDLKFLNAELDQVLEQKNSLLRQLSRSSGAAQSGVLISSLVHEIAQPLNALTLNAEYLRRKIEENHSESYLVAAADDLLSNISRVTETVSTVRALFSQKETLMAQMSLTQTVIEVLDLLEPQLTKSGIRLVRKIDQDAQIYGDQIQIRMVLMNLLHNAMDAMQNPGKDKQIVCSIQRTGAHVRLEVTDNGPGIASELSSRMWDLYASFKQGGSGIGLWLSRMIIEHHRGLITHSPINPSGAKFTIELPLTA